MVHSPIVREREREREILSMSRIIERVSLLCSTSTDLSVFLPSVWLTVIEILDPFFFILILVSIRSNSCVFDREENNVIKIVKVESNQR